MRQRIGHHRTVIAVRDRSTSKAARRALAATIFLLLAAPDADAQYGDGSAGRSGSISPGVTRYELSIADTMVDYSGKERRAIAVNGRIPMPTLTFTEGDTALIVVHNRMDVETSLHWHGLILPNEMDGVPYLTTAPIPPGVTVAYRFPLVQSGTYWYHSHTQLQEQVGMYGALIIHKRDEPPMPEQVIILSDWTDADPAQVHRRLHNANDWPAIQKHRVRPGSVQSYLDAIKAGRFGTKVTNEWKRMRAMDVSDVYYERFLANGRTDAEAAELAPGQRVRLRIINGSSSTYFWISYAGGRMAVVASDGMDVEPVDVDRFIMGVAETYDVLVDLPADSTAYELLATSEDRTGSASVWLGRGVRQLDDPLGPLDYFAGMGMMNDMMRMDGSMDDMGMRMALQRMDMNAVMYPEVQGPPEGGQEAHAAHRMTAGPLTLNYGMLRSPVPTTLPPGPLRELRFELTGNMDRYLWTIDNRTVSESDRILIKKGENLRIILHNNSMMRHPMHLHGHFFRVLNGQGDHAPLKNVLDIMPMETDTIEFAATEYGDWFFHCHILYHMMSGMGRVFSYADSPPNAQLPDAQKAWRSFLKDDRYTHLMFQNDFATNGNDGEAMLQGKRWKWQAEWRLGYMAHHGYEVETHLGALLGPRQWWFPYIGFDWRDRTPEMSAMPEDDLFGQGNTKDHRAALCLGVQYTLPMLFVLDARIDSDQRVRAQLMREDIPLTPRARLDLMGNSDLEYMARVRYILTKELALTSHYDSDMGFGVGLAFTY